MTMRVLLILAAISFSAAAFAQSTPPKIGDKPLAQMKPREPTGCKLVGTVKGTKLWAGDCVGSELRPFLTQRGHSRLRRPLGAFACREIASGGAEQERVGI